eukprot:RCo045761
MRSGGLGRHSRFPFRLPFPLYLQVPHRAAEMSDFILFHVLELYSNWHWNLGAFVKATFIIYLAFTMKIKFLNDRLGAIVVVGPFFASACVLGICAPALSDHNSVLPP